MPTEHAWLKTQLGWIHLQGHEAGLTRLLFAAKAPAGHSRGGALTADAVACLERYFAGELTALGEIRVAPLGTEFQLTVWRALRTVLAGDFMSYAELAERVGRPSAVRAVGQANRRNPLPLVVPCHRIVASDGSLGGYSAGRERKAWLLAHERVQSLVSRKRRAVRRAAATPPAPLPLFEGDRAW